MARTRDIRLWGLAVFALCLLGVGGGLAAGSAESVFEGRPQPAVAFLSATADVAVLPARAVDEIRSTGSTAPSRVVVLGAVLTTLLGLPARPRRHALVAGHGPAPLHSRRHTIALRAPPAPVRVR